MKEFLTALGLLLISFGVIKLAIAIIQHRKERDHGRK